jgi:hypothetical protein
MISYKKSQFEFTTLSALDLIKKATGLARVQVDPMSFLKVLEESVCILRPEGLIYIFSHRSFQEYFAAVFIARGSSDELRPLLDVLAARRGDIVIPMAMEMNRDLLEREWVLPRIRELAGLAQNSSEGFGFARRLFGGLIFSVSETGARLITAREDLAGADLSFVYSLKDVYPQFIDAIETIFQLSDEDFVKTRALWMDRRKQCWHAKYGKDRGLNKDPFKGEWAHPGDRHVNDFEEFMSLSNSDFNFLFSEPRELRGYDSVWLNQTSVADQLRLLPSQIVLLSQHLIAATE